MEALYRFSGFAEIVDAVGMSDIRSPSTIDETNSEMNISMVIDNSQDKIRSVWRLARARIFGKHGSFR